MCDLLKHRGPDDKGFFIDNQLSMGMRRLSIIDLETGHQPQHNEKEDIWIVYNGEIYNYIQLREVLTEKGHNFYTSSDTEVIIHAYEEWGIECVRKFRGPFTFCIYDTIKKKLFLARDHIGLKPLYYYINDGILIFASEIKAILYHEIIKELDRKALNLYLSLRYTPFDLTLIKKIKKIPSSHYMIYDLESNNYTIKKYWDINFEIRTEKPLSLLALELRNLLEESVNIRLISDVPLGAFLSGGIDSSSIVALMSNLKKDPVKTFSIGFGEGASINETKYSRFVAEYYNTDHKEIIVKSPDISLISKIVWHLDDLISDAASIPVYLMANHARERMTVALTGDGADEVFSGYSIYYLGQKKSYMNYFPNSVFNVISNISRALPSFRFKILTSYINSLSTETDRFLREIIYITDEEKSLLFYYNPERVKEILKEKIDSNLDIINQAISWDLRYQLPSQYNMKIDKMTMAASLEARVPFLDREIITWASHIPSNYKFNNSIEKYILRLAVKDLLPSRILKRKKLGFSTPVNYWLKTGFKEYSDEILDSLAKREKIIKSKYVKFIKKNKEKLFFVNRAWNLIMFELWYETFIESDGLSPLNIY